MQRHIGWNAADRATQEVMLCDSLSSLRCVGRCSCCWLQAHMFKVPLLALKAVTDIVDGERPTGEEFLENLHKTVETLTVSSTACSDLQYNRALEVQQPGSCLQHPLSWLSSNSGPRAGVHAGKDRPCARIHLWQDC